MHFWLAAERQIAYVTGTIAHPPAGEPTMPPTKGLFANIGRIDREWMPQIRRLVDAEEARGKIVVRLRSLEEVDSFSRM